MGEAGRARKGREDRGGHDGRDGGGGLKGRRERTNLAIPPAVERSLEARGARRQRGPGPLNFRRQLTLSLETFDNLLLHSDPRQTQQMPEELYERVLELLSNPLSLESFHILHLGTYLTTLPGWAAEAGAGAGGLAERVDSFSFAEKLHLVEAAQARHAERLRRA